ncbi:LLM class flavin-dependent oxidoreductase [Actinomadura geliboluensis]|uniref:LLM class flavin-dependent oxidoreductase n=1 Tax=Actinomadura geliboluensis TaxID=882440 RepID=UPI003713E127
MKFGMPIPHAAGFKQAVEGLKALEDAGLDAVTVPEAYTFDAVSRLGYIAARTSRVDLATSILDIDPPVRPSIPMTLAALGPKNIALAAELFEAWQPIFYHPEFADEVFGDALAEGGAKRDACLPDDMTAQR